MKIDFSEIMSKQTDAELLEILTIKQSEYQPEAIAAADAEFLARGLDIEQINSAKQEVIEKETNREERANVSLSFFAKLRAFIFPNPLSVLVSRAEKAEGYEQKYRDTLRWTLTGAVFYIILILWLIH